MSGAITPQSAYPTAEQVMNRARAYANDSYRQGKGRILTDIAPFSIQYLNGALEELQDRLGNNSVITLIRDNVILGPLPPLAEINPAVQTFISYEGFFDGVTMHSLPKLPSDMRAPQKLWERQIGSNLPFVAMQQPMEGLPSCFQNQWLRLWEYRGDRIYFTGSTVAEEVRVRYEARLPMLADASDFANTEIQILSSVNALAILVVYHYAVARGAAAAQMMQADAEKMMRYIVRRYTRRAQSIPYNRRRFGSPVGDDNLGARLPF